jgi:acetate kinase
VGENAPQVREAVAGRLAYLGVGLDAERNRSHERGDADLSPRNAAVRTLVVNAREDIEIAHRTRDVLDR